ncbi:MAG: DUF4129 domain-containing protein [Flavobacteriales bacterium]
MDWKRKFRLTTIWVVLCVYAPPCPAQSAQDSVWTDSQWQDARQGIDYKDEREPEKPEEEKEQPAKESTQYEEPETEFDLSALFSSGTGKVICLLIVIAALALIIYFAMRSPAKLADRKLKAPSLADLEIMDTLPEETDIERFLRLALEAGDYKTAVRVLYISSLQRMHQFQFIIWKKDKTNYDYLNEMRRGKHYAQFRDLTLAYEVVWYGDVNIERNHYDALLEAFNRYNNQIDGGNR